MAVHALETWHTFESVALASAFGTWVPNYWDLRCSCNAIFLTSSICYDTCEREGGSILATVMLHAHRQREIMKQKKKWRSKISDQNLCHDVLSLFAPMKIQKEKYKYQHCMSGSLLVLFIDACVIMIWDSEVLKINRSKSKNMLYERFLRYELARNSSSAFEQFTGIFEDNILYCTS